MGWREQGVFMSGENTSHQLSITRSGRASRASQGVGQGRKSGPAASGLLGSGSLLSGAFSDPPLSSKRRDDHPSTPPNPGRQCSPRALPPGPRAGTSCTAGQQGQASLENKWPETPSPCGQGQNPSKSPSGRILVSRDAWAVGGWGSQTDFSQMREIWLKFQQRLMSATAEGWIPQGHPLPVWPCWRLDGFWKFLMVLAISGSLPGLGKPAETLTLQQAQNFQQSKSSSPRSRMRKMSSGMSQRKLPGGHSASDRHVTPRHQPRVCREGAGREGKGWATALCVMEQPS